MPAGQCLFPDSVKQAKVGRRMVGHLNGSRAATPLAMMIAGSRRYLEGRPLDRDAQRYSVSRTPVREALRQLATAGPIEIRPRRSAVVASVTPDQLEDLFEDISMLADNPSIM
jgi:DNA-binding GntR family transcriptional regulator